MFNVTIVGHQSWNPFLWQMSPQVSPKTCGSYLPTWQSRILFCVFHHCHHPYCCPYFHHNHSCHRDFFILEVRTLIWGGCHLSCHPNPWSSYWPTRQLELSQNRHTRYGQSLCSGAIHTFYCSMQVNCPAIDQHTSKNWARRDTYKVRWPNSVESKASGNFMVHILSL